jgi:hypothetical protein
MRMDRRMAASDLGSAVLDYFRGEGRAVVEEAHRTQQRRTLESRTADAAELTRLETDTIATLRAFEERRAPIDAEIAELEAALKGARERANAISVESKCMASAADRRRDRLQHQLRASASPLIATFVDEMRKLLAATYRERRTIAGKNLAGHLKIESLRATIPALPEAPESDW